MDSTQSAINAQSLHLSSSFRCFQSTEKIEDLDLYAPELEVHKYLKERLSHFDFSTLYELHYLMITMGKVFCTKSNPRCSACPLRNKCEYAFNGGKR